MSIKSLEDICKDLAYDRGLGLRGYSSDESHESLIEALNLTDTTFPDLVGMVMSELEAQGSFRKLEDIKSHLLFWLQCGFLVPQESSDD